MWPFGSLSKSKQVTEPSPFDAAVPPPPGGGLAPPPDVPKSLRGSIPAKEFKGFSPPPTGSVPSTSSIEESRKLSFFTGVKPKSDYSSEDFSKYTSSVRESSGVNDAKYYSTPSGIADQYITNPRARQCWESVKMGIKMGGSVGFIFGGLTGLYAAVVHRSPLLLPVSTIGGAISFGFFLGCGMLVRCEGPEGLQGSKSVETVRSMRDDQALVVVRQNDASVAK